MATLAPERPDAAPAIEPRSLTVEVIAAMPAARDAVTFALARSGTHQAPAPYRPGQFITLALPRGGRTLYRSYSLCGGGSPHAPWEITVKRARGGVVSNELIDRVRPGMRLRVSVPRGTFTLPAGALAGSLLVFVAAGSGITPIFGMLRALARLQPAQRPRVQLHYAHHSPADAIFGRQLAALDPQRTWLTQRWYVSTSGQRLTSQEVLAAAGAEAASAEWYLCGPAGLTREVREAALRWGAPAPRLHTEVFVSPAAGSAAAAASGQTAARVRLADSGAVLAARPGETVLETLERSGYRPDFSCRSGACGTCRLRLLSGQVCGGAGESDALTPQEQAAGDILSCVARPQGDITLATAGKRMAPSAVAVAGRTGASGKPRWVKPLRTSLIAAALGAFGGMLVLTSRTATSHSSSTTSSATSSSAASDSDDSSAGSSSSSTSSNGTSGYQTTTGSSSSNTSTGVS